ncbi:MAG: 1-deoxy-D-xylulose-5-phosphate reductoisomerase [Sulfurovum sp.]|nr:1-deoxy-D-xylulose-5-phosphate reductoisomerase [Sulfurovum sp.]MCB4745034.1 1-deoxy-D-xylulose-5-phosphate reductoisomerase [Sulfurovum sp.]MCB4746675.1 1-deoxy-D-xylulose-5-phosphate reductoisomerase [Sulfurovum sp.]MCB4748821.1 1-deoxy-D-xylulose-5-phosphate reductoisomerase [Sulfurovum sp.]MCB4749914.1 1-deoxy-D-xylulose-5-phosphate reductoisomerase [Sulfurovum sp.]
MVLLGSTGSIGVNTLVVAKDYSIEIEALVAGNNIDLLNQQIVQYKPKMVAIANKADKYRVNHPNVHIGTEGILSVIEESQSTTIVNALVGYTGVAPTFKAIQLGKKVALANKESLVVAGAFIDMSYIVPIDSEHFGLWYLMGDRSFSKLYITASGGAFREWSTEKMKDATFSDALKHPNWSMGNKITIDSATMTNKLFEILEAKWFFDTNNIDALIEKKSIIHALCEFKDGSTTAHFAGVDMKLPIAFALRDKIEESILPPVNLLEIGSLEFFPIKASRYPIWSIKEHILQNPHLGVVINAANEVAIEKFQKEKCSFFGMSDIVLNAYRHFEDIRPNDIKEIIEIDQEVRKYASLL